MSGASSEERLGIWALALASLRYYKGYAFVLALAVAVASSAPYLALALARTSSDALVAEFARAGALTYVVSEADSEGNPLPLSPELAQRARATSGVDAVVEFAQVSLSTSASVPDGPQLPVLFAESSLFTRSRVELTRGRLPQPGEVGWAVISHEGARLLQLDSGCVTSVTCTVEVGQASYPIIGILEPFTTELGVVVQDDARVYLDLRSGIETKTVEGANGILLESPLLPIERTTEALQRSFSDLRTGVRVDPPLAAGTLRGSVADQWQNVLRWGSVAVLGLTVASAVMVLSVFVRRRQSELLLLRTLGFTPRATWSGVSAEVGVMCLLGLAPYLAVVVVSPRFLVGVDVDLPLALALWAAVSAITLLIAINLAYRSAHRPLSSLVGQA